MRGSLALVLAALAGAAGAAEPSATLDDGQSRSLLQSLCAVPVTPNTDTPGGTWVCDEPRDYPRAGRCPLSLLGASVGSDSLATPAQAARIYRGRFTENAPQAVLFYRAGCEPHAANWGGMALLRITDAGYVLLRYEQGLVGQQCAVAPGGKRDRLFCLTSHMGQGELEQRFGHVLFAADGSASFKPGPAAGNKDGMLSPMTACPRPQPPVHHFTGVVYDATAHALVLSGMTLAKRNVEQACGRLARGEFNEREQELRKEGGALARRMAFLREDEPRLVPMRMQFKLKADGSAPAAETAD